MPQRETLRGHFTNMLETAQATAAEYDRLAQQAKDPFQREMLDQLVREGNRHVELAQRLIEIVDE